MRLSSREFVPSSLATAGVFTAENIAQPKKNRALGGGGFKLRLGAEKLSANPCKHSRRKLLMILATPPARRRCKRRTESG
jgi:hypothetical protein